MPDPPFLHPPLLNPPLLGPSLLDSPLLRVPLRPAAWCRGRRTGDGCGWKGRPEQQDRSRRRGKGRSTRSKRGFERTTHGRQLATTARERQFTRDERRSGGLPSPVRFVFRKPRARRRERRTPATKAGSFVRIGIGRRLRSCRTQEGRTAAAAAGFERYRSHERLLRPAWISSTKNTTPPTRRTR